ncbi:hypothetical protein JCM10212_005051 [Sporobolomyces blumeae]
MVSDSIDPSLAGLAFESLDPSLFPDHQQQPPPPDQQDDQVPSTVSSPSIKPRERDQLRVVAQGLAPNLVLDQPLSVPGAPPTLRHCLANDAPLLPISVLRACFNEASTNALFSSATAFDATGDETTRLLNDVDSFQEMVNGLLDEVERQYVDLQDDDDEDERGGSPRADATGKAKSTRGKAKKGIKREADEDFEVSTTSTATKRYMLHRNGPNGTDLFTSAAILSGYELEQISQLPETDLITLHPPAPSLPLSSPVPSLGSLNPVPSPSLPRVPVSLRYNLAPGQQQQPQPSSSSSSSASSHPPLAYPADSTQSILNPHVVRETVTIEYGPFASFGPRFDTTGATDGGYTTSLARFRARERVKRFDRDVLSTTEEEDEDEAREPLDVGREVERVRNERRRRRAQEGREEGRRRGGRGRFGLSDQDEETVRSLHGELAELLLERDNDDDDGDGDGDDVIDRVETRIETESIVWNVLSRNLDLIRRLEQGQVARVRTRFRSESGTTTGKSETARAGEQGGGVQGQGEAAATMTKVEDRGERSGLDEDRDESTARSRGAHEVELRDAESLLSSFASLVSTLSTSTVSPSLFSSHPSRSSRASTSSSAKTTNKSFKRSLDDYVGDDNEHENESRRRRRSSIVPGSTLIRSLTPLIVGEVSREPSYHGTLESHHPSSGLAVRANHRRSGFASGGVGGGGGGAGGGEAGWEKAVKEGSESNGAGAAAVKQE